SLLAFPVIAAERTQLSGHVLPGLAGLETVGRVPASPQLNLFIWLPLRNPQGLTIFLRQVYDPKSPAYHRYLSPAQFTEAFGPTEQEYQALVNFAQANGLIVKTRYSNRMLLDVTGPAASIEAAFQITLKLYKHPKENRNFFATEV